MKSIKITRQVGPTCGIYAFLNGMKVFYSLNELDDKRMHKIVFELLEKNGIKIEGEKEEINEQKYKDRMTFIGEFFDIDNFVDFLEENKKLIIKKINENLNLNIEIKKIKIDKINDDKNTFYISPVLRKNKVSKKMKDNENMNPEVLHWISHQVVNKDGEKYKFMKYFKEKNCTKKSGDIMYLVIDSNKKRTYSSTLKEIIDENDKLQEKTFKWSGYTYQGKCKFKKFFLSFTDESKNKIDSWVTRRMECKPECLDTEIYKHGEVVVIKKI